MIAGVFAGDKRPGEEVRHQFFRFFRRSARYDVDMAGGEQLPGTLAHAAGDDLGDAFFAEPFREQSGFVGGRRDEFTGRNAPGIDIDVDQGEFFAMPEMLAQFSLCCWRVGG